MVSESQLNLSWWAAGVGLLFHWPYGLGLRMPQRAWGRGAAGVKDLGSGSRNELWNDLGCTGRA